MKRLNKLRVLSFLVAIFIVIFFITSNTKALKNSSSHFYTKNDILFYDPNDSNSNSYNNHNDCYSDNNQENNSIQFQGNSNAEKIYRFLTSTPFAKNDNKPLSPVQAAAIIGNIGQESAFNPLLTNPNGGAFGLFQWLGGRKNNLINFSKDKNIDHKTLEAQLLYFKHELDNTSEGVNLFKVKDFGNSNPNPKCRSQNFDFKNETDLKRATLAFRCIFERPRDYEANDEKRLSYAEKALSDFGGIKPKINENCNQGATSYNDNYQVFLQDDPKGDWKNLPYSGGTMGNSGCGVAAMATILKNFGYNVTIKEIIDLAKKSGAMDPTKGTVGGKLAEAAANKYNLRLDNKIGRNANDINKVLDNNGVVYISGRGGPPYTSYGHFVVIYGRTSNGKWKIAQVSLWEDKKSNYKREWEYSALLQGGVTCVALYKK